MLFAMGLERIWEFDVGYEFGSSRTALHKRLNFMSDDSHEKRMDLDLLRHKRRRKVV